MEYLKYVFAAVLAAISVSFVIFCIVRGKGTSHKWLICFASIFCVMAAICFGGQAVLNRYDLGWRCTPFNTMLFLCAALLIATLWFCIRELISLQNVKPAVTVCGVFSLFLMMLVTLWLFAIYSNMLSWHDSLSSYNGQTIVCANDQHGGSCAWRYYVHINGLIHGAEITQYGWHGYPPFSS